MPLIDWRRGDASGAHPRTAAAGGAARGDTKELECAETSRGGGNVKGGGRRRRRENVGNGETGAKWVSVVLLPWPPGVGLRVDATNTTHAAGRRGSTRERFIGKGKGGQRAKSKGDGGCACATQKGKHI